MAAAAVTRAATLAPTTLFPDLPLAAGDDDKTLADAGDADLACGEAAADLWGDDDKDGLAGVMDGGPGGGAGLVGGGSGRGGCAVAAAAAAAAEIGRAS